VVQAFDLVHEFPFISKPAMSTLTLPESSIRFGQSNSGGEFMPQIVANSISIEYDTFGDSDARPLLLVMGLGAQMIQWRAEFCEQLAGAGHFVIRFDNRDSGLSEKFGHLGVPNLGELMSQVRQGEPLNAPYTLDDLAADALGVLDELNIAQAHICGASMGGMIVQAMAINAPERIKSLTSIMSTTGNPELPPSREQAMAALLSPAATNREEAIIRSYSVNQVIGSPGFRAPEQDIKERAAEAYDRNFYPEGVTRQMAAITAHGSRKAALQSLSVPALVIHGKDDPLVTVEGGVDTHHALQGSLLHLIEGMGHDLPEPVWPEIVRNITELTSRHH
jgi:pimeloyl-ACP methyl ester carboxylesterase